MTSNINKEVAQGPEETPLLFIVLLKTKVLPSFCSLWDSGNTPPRSLDKLGAQVVGLK